MLSYTGLEVSTKFAIAHHDFPGARCEAGAEE